MKITKGTIIRTVLLILVLANIILEKCGVDIICVDESVVASGVETLIEIGAIAASWWYNNSFTEKAKKADAFMKELNESSAE